MVTRNIYFIFAVERSKIKITTYDLRENENWLWEI